MSIQSALVLNKNNAAHLTEVESLYLQLIVFNVQLEFLSEHRRQDPVNYTSKTGGVTE